MKVLLIQPNLDQPEQYCPPLGIGYLATALEAQGFDVSILDMDVENLGVVNALSRINRLAPEVIGITSTVANAARARQLGALLQQEAFVVHGGPEPTVSAENYLYSNPQTCVIRGEGEQSFVELVQGISTGEDWTDVPGLSYLLAAGLRHNRLRQLPPDLATSSFPARHLFKMEKYRASLNGERATSIIGSRFCTYKCLFCHNGILGSFYRRRSPCDVAQEMEHIAKEYDLRALYFYDCSLTVEKNWVGELCQHILALGPEFMWQCMSRAGSLDLETLKMMRKAGCVRIASGVESGSERSLALMKKGIKLSQIEAFIQNVKQAGIIARIYLILGFPWETVQDFEATLAFVRRVKPDEVAVSFASPFRGTKLYEQVKDRFDFEMYNDSRVLREPSFSSPHFQAEDLISYRRMILAAVNGG